MAQTKLRRPQIQVVDEWYFATSTTMADPGAGFLRGNNATVASITALAISITTDGGLNSTTTFSSLNGEDIIIIQQADTPSKWVRFQIQSTPTNNTTWFQFSVIVLNSSGSGTPAKDTDVIMTVVHAADIAQADDYIKDLVGTMVTGNIESGITVTYDGDKLNFVVNISSQIREKLSATRTYYVRTDGNDSNTGLANNSGSAFLTVQRAVNVCINEIDTAGHNVTIQIADGTYSQDVILGDCIGSGTITIQGNSGTPANVVIGSFMKWGGGSSYTVKDLKFTKVSATSAIGLRYGARINFTNVNFGGSYTYHIESLFGANAICDGNYTISGGAAAHISARAFGGITVQSKTITLTGTPNFTTAFAECRYTGVMFANGNTFSGSATGSRYLVDLNGVIQTVGGGANYFPGNAAGSAATGGQYA